MRINQPSEPATRKIQPRPCIWPVMAALCVSVAGPARSQAPDLTAGSTRLTIATNSQYYIGGQCFTYNLGPTGLRGWIYALGDGTLDQFTSVAPWQILVASVGTNTPAVGLLLTNDVILGAQAGLPPVALFTNDSRVCLGNAITAAEAGNGQLSFLVNRYDASQPTGAGTNASVTIQLAISNLAYSATAPYNCPKSALLLSNALNVLNKMAMSRSVALALLASGNTNYLPAIQSYARSLAPTNLALGWPSYQGAGGGLACWDMGYNGAFLAEYYMVTNDAQVVNGLTQYIVMTAKSGTMFGCYNHGGAIVMPYHVAAGVHGYACGYGPVNSCGVLCNLAVALGQKTGIPGIVTNAEVSAAVIRADNFFGYYVNKGGIPYGEMPPYLNNWHMNGRDGLAALFFGVQGNQPTQTQYFTRLSLSSYHARETGHSGSGWGLCWEPMGNIMGGTNAVAGYFSNLRWQYELNRRSDGSYAFDCPGDVTTTARNYWDYEGYQDYLDPTAWNALFLSASRQALFITGKNANPTNFIAADVASNAIWAGQWPLNASSYPTNQLLANLGEYDPTVRHEAAQQLASLCRTNASLSSALTPQLMALTTNTNAWVRAAACDALGAINTAAALNPLVARLNDPDVWVRFQASQAVDNLGTAALPQLTNIMAAFVSNAVANPLVSINWNDPCGWGNGYLADLLFNKLAGSTINQNTNLLYPAVRAGLQQPDRGCQGYLNSFLTAQLRWADVQALAPDLIAASTIPAQADEMWEGAEGAAPACLAKFGVEDGLAALSVMTEAGIASRYGWETTVLAPAYHNYGLSATNLLPVLNNLKTVESGGLSGIMTSYITALQGNPTPPPPTYFKQITSVAASQPVIGLSVVSNAANTVLSVASTALDAGVPRYTWSVAQGPGPVTFTPNGTPASSNSTALFSVPGTYVLQVMAVNSSILNSNLFWNPSLSGGAYVSGNATWNFNTWTNNFGAIATNLSVAVWPAHSVLSNTAATTLTSSSATLNAMFNGTLSNAYAVTAFWGATNAGTNAALWNHSAYAGSWTNVFTANVSLGIGALAAGTTYYFAFRATSAVATNWATNVLSFTTINANNATLAALTASAGTLAPAFAGNTLSYTSTVGYRTTNLAVTPTAVDLKAAISVNGSAVVSGNPSALIHLNVGANVINPVVVSADLSATNTYTLMVTRVPASSNANLTSLVPSLGNLAPAFASNTFSYSVSVPNTNTSITVTPAAADIGAAITVNGGPVTSGSPSGSIGLTVGVNAINTVVGSSDFTTTNTYTLTVTRAALPVRWWDGGTTNLAASGDGVASGGSGSWSTTIQNWDQGGGQPHVAWNNANNDTAIFAGTAGAVTLGAGVTVGGLDFEISGYTVSGTNPLSFGRAATITNVLSAGTTTIGTVVAGNGAITNVGAGTLVLNGAATNTFNGGLVLNGGTLLADFTNQSTPPNLINSNNSITLGGGSLSIKGKRSGTTSQTLGNVIVNAGGGQILGNNNGGTSTTINLGTIAATNAGGSLLVGNATTTTGNAPVITTTTNNLDATGIYGSRVVFCNANDNLSYDWATTASSAAPYTLSGYGGYTSLPATGGAASVNYNLTAALTGVGTESVNTLKVANVNLTQTSGTRLTIAAGGLLSTGDAPTISGGTLTAGNSNGACDFIIHSFCGRGLTVSSVIDNNGTNAVNLVKTGSGGVMFNGNNTYSGNTYVNAGVLHFGITSLSGFGGGSGRNIYIAAGAGAICVTPNNAFLSRIVQTSDEITIGTGTDGGLGVVDFSGSYGGTYFPNAYLGNWWGNSAKAEFSGTLIPANDTYRLGSPISAGVLAMLTTLTDGANPRSLIVAGTVDLVAANTFSGDTFLRPTAQLFLGNPLALQNSPLNVGTGLASDANTGRLSLSDGTGNVTGNVMVPNPTLGGLKGGRDLLSVYSTGYGGNVSPLTTSAVTGFTLNVGAGQTCIYSGAIGEFATGTTLDIVGAGTQVLSGASTYTGGTTINSGTLLANNTNGSGTGSGGVTINRSGTLGGPGTISGTVSVNAGGTVSPGNGIGTLITGSESWGSGGAILFEVASATNSAGRDLLTINGALNVAATSDNPFIVSLAGMASNNTPGLVPDFKPGVSDTWVMATASGGILNFDPGKFVVDAGAFNNALNGNFSVAVQGNSLVLNYVATLTPPVVAGYGLPSGGSFPLSFSGPNGQSYTVLASTNVALPLTNWTVLTNGIFGASLVNYTNTSATNARQFYLIRSP